MQTKTKTVEMITLTADPGMVLCDGQTRTSVGGQVIAPAGSDLSSWKEMTPEEADAIIADYEASLAEEEGGEDAE